MAKRIIKPDSGNTLVLQEDNGSIDALTVETSGDVTLAGNFTSKGIDDNASSTALTIDSSGNVGIGTSPSQKLEVLVNQTTGSKIYTKLDGTSNKFTNLVIDCSEDFDDSRGLLNFYHDSTQSASVGINYRTSDGAADHLQLRTYETDQDIVLTATGEITASTAGTERMRIDSSGNVGIGTSSPGRKFEVQSNGGQVRISDTDGSYGELFTNAGDFTIRSTGDGASGTIDGIITFDVTSSGTTSEGMRIDSSGNLKFNSGYGSVATAYGCRAWVNFNGTGTVAIRESGNVSSITDNGTGDYTVNFTTALPDANYAVNCTTMRNFTGTGDAEIGYVFNNTTYSNSYSTTSIRVKSTNYNGFSLDSLAFNVAVFR